MLTNMARARLARGQRRRFPSEHASPASDTSISCVSEMPPDRARTANPQGRQKSCSECAKAKRRCGLEHPCCARCRRQNLLCAYPPQPRAQGSKSRSESTSDDHYSLDNAEVPLSLQDAGLPDLTFDFEIPAESSTADILDFDFSAGINSLESLSTMLYNSPNEEDQMGLQRSFNQVAKPFSSAHISPFARSRVEYSFEQLKLAPKMMVDENCTPWAHTMLYEEHMPRSLQDAHAACALYVTKTAANVESVTRYITSRVIELATSAIPIAPLDVLARAHALMLYQVMLIFGGEVRFHDLAEMMIPHMEDVGAVLLPISKGQVDSEGTLPLYPSAAARSEWKAYILRESLRRTSLSIYHITALCHLLRGQLVSCADHLAVGNRVTFSAHLWQAKSAFDFALAWNEKKHFLIKDLDFTEVFQDARPDDLDTFCRMMMVGLQGIDDLRGWFHTRGGTL